MEGEENVPEPTGLDAIDAAADALDAGAAEAPPEPPPEPPPEASFLERLSDPNADMPAWYRATERAAEGKPVEITDEQLANLPSEAQAALYNMRRELLASRERATEAVSDLEARERDIAERERRLGRERTSLHTGLDAALRRYIDERIRPPTGEAPDPDSPAGIEYLVQDRVHKFLTGFTDQIGQFYAEGQKRLEEQEAAHQAQTAEDERRAWIRQHMQDDGPLMDEGVRNDVIALTQKGFEPDDALELALAKQAMAREKDERLQARVAARRRTMRANNGEVHIPPTPEGLSVQQRYEFYARYPEAKERDQAEGLKIRRSLA